MSLFNEVMTIILPFSAELHACQVYFAVIFNGEPAGMWLYNSLEYWMQSGLSLAEIFGVGWYC